MLVHPVVIPGSGTRSWTVLGDDDVPVVPVDRFLAYLTDIGRSPNTVKAYAHDLKDYWRFIGFRGLDWREARLEDVGEFVAWLQLPPAGRAGEIAVLPSVTAQVTASTVNRKLAAVSAFYAHQARNGAGVGDLLAAWRTGGRGGWKPFLHHVTKGESYRGRAITLKAEKKLPRILTVSETQAILDACTRLRDRFFFALLYDSGVFSRGANPDMPVAFRVWPGQRLINCGWLCHSCGATTPCCGSPAWRGVELGHEFAVGGAGGGELLVAFLELEPQVCGLLLELRGLLAEGIGVGGCAEPGFAPGLLAEGLR